MFNIVFAVQISLDATYLIGGATLPEGMTYASYAHRGAYTLIFTALLAAAFVLFATRPGSHSGASKRVRSLVLAWTAQNVLLVAFSIQRLWIYVDVYALTYWRIAAFIWMALVLIGLILIVAKLLRQLTNRWLVSSNLISLCAVLYLTSLTNVPGVIADFNVRAALQPQAVPLDAGYLYTLGPAALPAIDRLLQSGTHLRIITGDFKHTYSYSGAQAVTKLQNIRDRIAIHTAADTGWRQWSYRLHRLQTYLDTTSYTRVPNEPYRNTP